MLVRTPRPTQILSTTHQFGNVRLADLALRLNVTPQTIRRDLNDLCNEHLLARTPWHRAIIPRANMAYNSRRPWATIGIAIDEVARALVHHEGLLVIPNHIHVATIQVLHPRTDVLIVGVLQKSHGGFLDEKGIAMITIFKVNRAVMGGLAIDAAGCAARVRVPRSVCRASNNAKFQKGNSRIRQHDIFEVTPGARRSTFAN